MRVVFINRFFYPDLSATSQLLTDLALDLADAGWEVQVVTSRQRYDDSSQALPAREESDGVTVHRVWSTRFGRHFLPLRTLDYFTFYLFACWRLWRLTGPGDLLVAKTDPPLISIPAAYIARQRRAILVNWLQDLFPEVAVALRVRLLKKDFGRWLRRMRNRSLEAARANVVIGKLMRRRLEREGIPGSRIWVIHNWAPGEAIYPLAGEENRLRRGWGLESYFVVGYSGNLGRAHEFDTLLGAAERLRSDNNIRFLIIGDGARKAYLKRKAEKKGLHNIVFRPYQPRELLRLSLTVADVHLVSLRPHMEGMLVPSKFAAIAAAGRPALFIGEPRGEIARMIKREEAGLCFNPGDADGLAAAIRGLSLNPERLAEMGRNARTLFEREYASHRSLEQWRGLLRMLWEAGQSELPNAAAPAEEKQ